MRSHTATWTEHNLARSKEPRYVIRLSFDADNTVIYEFTSHADAATSGTATGIISGVVKGITGTSQSLNPDRAVATIGNIAFQVTDKSSAINTALGAQLTLGRSTREQRVQIYMGWYGDAWADYSLIQTQLVEEITYKDGTYGFRLADIQRAMRKEIFVTESTTLTATALAADTTINAVDTSLFTTVAHGTSYTDAPSSTVGYIRIESEVIRYTGKTATTFTGCTRGVLNTKAADHVVDTSSTQERRTKVEEFVYLELSAVDLAYRILTGKDKDGNAVMPTKWHLGISTDYVRLADFTGIGADLWDTADADAGFITRFEGLTKTDGKAFIESELMILLGCFMPIYNDGAVGLRRMSAVLAGAAYVEHLDDDNIVNYSELTHDFRSLHNEIQINWNYDPIRNAYTRATLLLDTGSRTTHGAGDPLRLNLRGLHGARHAKTVLDRRFAAIRDRYAGPPLRLSVECLPSLNTIEVGDIVRVTLEQVRDFVAAGTLDRSFEVQNVQVDWITGKVNLSLFASSQAAGALDATETGTALSDGFYTGTGTELSTVLTIAAGHVTASGSLTGNTDMNAAGAIYYYDGDLTIDAGATITISNNVQLRVKGFLQINGAIDGQGNGLAGATAPAAVCADPVSGCLAYVDDYTAGTAGFLGTTISGGAIIEDSHGFRAQSVDGYTVVGKNPVVPEINLTHDSDTLSGIPTDMRGSSGSSGRVSAYGTSYTGSYFPFRTATAGDGGDGGAGLSIICRGYAFGASGSINLSGAAGTVGTTLQGYVNSAGNTFPYSGSGAGGAPGGCLIVLDGSAATDDSLTGTFIAKNGAAPIPTGATVLYEPTVDILSTDGSYHYSYAAGQAGTDAYPVADLSGSRGGCRIQRIYPNTTTEADSSATLRAPSSFSLDSGTDALLVNGDGTIVPRIKATWTASTDPRTLAYDTQFKPSADSVWASAPTLFGATSALAYISPVKDGVNYDVRIRAAADLRQVSEWVTITGHTVIGKSEAPADVTGFTGSQNGALVVLRWSEVTDVDLAGYDIRYGSTSATFASATPISSGITLRGTQVTTASIPPGTWRFFIKAQDASGNQSATAATFDLTVTSALDIIYQQEQAPTWPGEIHATGDQLLMEDGFALLKESGELLMLESATNTFVRHWTGKLFPNSLDLASADDPFASFVPNPVPTCIYDAPEIDAGFDDDPRVWGSIDSELGPGETTGTADPHLYIDYRLEAGSYAGFVRRDIGELTGRYFKHRLQYDTADGVAVVNGFLPTVDQQEWTQHLGTQTIAAGGSTVAFPIEFHTVPTVQGTLVGGGAALVVDITNVTETSCDVDIYDNTNTSVGGTANIDATGV